MGRALATAAAGLQLCSLRASAGPSLEFYLLCSEDRHFTKQTTVTQFCQLLRVDLSNRASPIREGSGKWSGAPHAGRNDKGLEQCLSAFLSVPYDVVAPTIKLLMLLRHN